VNNPKLFISYSWSSESHEEWVLNLATELRGAGVDVILDKWDLKKGHDAIAFMERMVGDPEIKKVIMIVDKHYAEKANDRSGGVGTETQIISKEVYEKQQQDKFVAVSVEKDEQGKPYSPIYYKSRIHIDFSDSEKYGEKLEELLRWIFDKPLYVKPELGKIPEFIDTENPIQLSTSIVFKRTLDLLKNNKPNALGSLNEYLESLANGLEKFRIAPSAGEFDDAVIKNIDEFFPYLNEFVKMLLIISQYTSSDEFVVVLHKFFERLIPYTQRPKKVTSWKDWDFDNFKFIAYELYLYTMAIFLKYEKFHFANYLMEQRYYVEDNPDNGRDAMEPYDIFVPNLSSLEHRNQRLMLRRLSPTADLVKQRAELAGIEFRYLMQADFVLFMRAEIGNQRWWPHTLVYAARQYSAFEIFARAASRKYFDKVKVVLNIKAPADLQPLIQSYRDGSRNLPRWYAFDAVEPLKLMGYEKLATLP